jgi:hypothetical protein
LEKFNLMINCCNCCIAAYLRIAAQLPIEKHVGYFLQQGPMKWKGCDRGRSGDGRKAGGKKCGG